jgi:hypothetical protein
MRRHYLTALVALFLGVGAIGLIALAQETQEPQALQEHGGFFNTDRQIWVDITDEGLAQIQQLQQQQGSELCLQDPIGSFPSSFLLIPSEDNPLLCISFLRRVVHSM